MGIRRVGFGLLALALLVAQALALMHRVAHATEQPVPAPLAVHAAPAHDHGHGAAHDAQGWLPGLFPHAAGDLDCRVLDSLGHDGLAPLPSLALPAAAPPALLVLAAGEFLARWAALFDARGPPLSR